MHPAAKKLAAAAACLVYMTISSALIVLNQQLMNEDGFRYPMALSGLGMGFSAVASYIACKVSTREEGEGKTGGSCMRLFWPVLRLGRHTDMG